MVIVIFTITFIEILCYFLKEYLTYYCVCGLTLLHQSGFVRIRCTSLKSSRIGGPKQ